MQLKITRSQREGGVLSKVAIFAIDARVEFTRAEQASVTRYRLGSQMIYSSEGAKRAAEGSIAAGESAKARGINTRNVDDFLFSATDTIGHGMKAVALGALAHMRLSITIDSLQRGHHIECKSLEEVLGAEEALKQACQNLQSYLLTAATFDGNEQVYSFEAPDAVHEPSPAVTSHVGESLPPPTSHRVSHETPWTPADAEAMAAPSDDIEGAFKYILGILPPVGVFVVGSMLHLHTVPIALFLLPAVAFTVYVFKR